ncbi:MAG TPA: hypothetical protein DCM68_07770 [Verrucomicrobia bacterium]|nr:hypothetical protein [Verrucomicrobiota bacterium]
MTKMPTPSNPKKRLPWVPGAVLLAFALVGALWASTHFSAEARVRRATARIVRLVQKEGAEAPVSLGLSANRLGKFLSTNAVLELEGFGPLAAGRNEIVQFYAQVRNSFLQIGLADPRIVAVALRRGEVQSFVDARYRFAENGGQEFSGEGKATLLWRKGGDGWQISRATLRADERTALPKGWP